MGADNKVDLTVNGGDLRMFIPTAGTREGDNPLLAIFREVENLRTLAQVAKGTRMETENAMSGDKMATALRKAREQTSSSLSL